MAPIDPGSFVLVTGGNGFIAAHCIATLLRSNYRVRATVRSFEKGEATRKSLSSAGVDNLSLLEIAVVPDPTDLNAFIAILHGCQAILHLASAFNYDAVPGEFEEKLMIPAVKGTQVVCEAARLDPNIRRVVIMSSFASVYDASLGLQPGRVYTENDWCPLTYEDGVTASMVPTAYRASKVVAERAAWDYIRDNPVQYQLMTLCPGMVFGRMIHPISSLSQLNASNQIIWQVLSAGKDAEVPPTKAPVWIDVEDLAETSLRTLTFSGSGNERFLVTQASYDTQEVADIIRSGLPDRQRVPVGEPGRRIADTHYSCDSSKVQRLLGVRFRTLEESIIPLANQLYDMEGV
ncbi:uncharacterized protein N7446_011745 [Penicillium canescens]|uniref:NAD-dependent epimerase/dehydratase domain-containing protein n=1 Tax=Penicillium canescens TaxID=5083 RepID=A0AAD6IG61_PENCN|nr:uncharacterized protein N7446_011745 [Penicillium canescens]KAJ6028915.1 hypothetical protein N7444_011902 [Penicillium canescens]KAJ6047349.1 hypothetical protein N7460_003496 [Penicillium canescens]KAJ6049062.1 hypothetical protein N7446_011745 [Penicillium canescens]